MSFFCIRCDARVRDGQEALMCESCELWQHRTCGTGIRKNEYDMAVRGDITLDWQCGPCSRRKRPRMDDRRPVAESTRTSEDLRRRLPAIPNEEPPSDEDLDNFEVIEELDVQAEIQEMEVDDAVDQTVEMNVDEAEEMDVDEVEEMEVVIQDVESVREEPAANDRLDATFDVQRLPINNNIPTEPSLDDPIVHDINAEMIDQFEVVPGGSQRGKDLLVHSAGYSFAVTKQKNQTVYWRCSVRTCRSTVIQQGPDIFTHGNNRHNHAPIMGLMTKTKITAKIKKQCKKRKNMFVTASSMVRRAVLRETENDQNVAIPRLDYLKRAANWNRQQMRPSDPQDLEFEVNEEFVGGRDFFRGDVRVDNKRHLIFATDHQLSLLRRARTWYMDGTFKIIKEPFTQLFSIHAFIRYEGRYKQVPLIMVCMSRRKKKDYRAIFNEIRNILGAGIELKTAVADFEKAVWRTLGECFPDVNVRGCAFHWAQAVWRKIQDVGLQRAYFNDNELHKFLRRLFALPFLPAEHIPEAFRILRQRNENASVRLVLSYMENSWMTSNVWPIAAWSVYRQPIRTNNDVEGWHRRINSMAGKTNLPFYLLIRLLLEESQLVQLQERLLRDGKILRLQRESKRRIEGQIVEAWDDYDNGIKTASQLLKCCSRLYSPLVPA